MISILNFIKKHYKQILIILSILLIIILSLIIRNMSHKISDLKNDYDRMSDNLNNSSLIITQYKDKNDKCFNTIPVGCEVN